MHRHQSRPGESLPTSSSSSSQLRIMECPSLPTYVTFPGFTRTHGVPRNSANALAWAVFPDHGPAEKIKKAMRWRLPLRTFSSTSRQCFHNMEESRLPTFSAPPSQRGKCRLSSPPLFWASATMQVLVEVSSAHRKDPLCFGIGFVDDVNMRSWCGTRTGDMNMRSRCNKWSLLMFLDRGKRILANVPDCANSHSPKDLPVMWHGMWAVMWTGRIWCNLLMSQNWQWQASGNRDCFWVLNQWTRDH